MARKVRTKHDYKNNAPSALVPNTSEQIPVTSDVNPAKTDLSPIILESVPGPNTVVLNQSIISGVKESSPVIIPTRRGRDYQTLRNLAGLEDESVRALRLANAACERIAARVDEVDGRDAHSWLASAIAYCDWRGGRFEGSRAWADRNLRDEVDKDGYLGAVRLLKTALNTPDSSPMGLAAPVLSAAPAATPEELELEKRARPALVAELLSLRPELAAGRKSLAKFKRPKLARMVSEARAAAAAAAASERRRA